MLICPFCQTDLSEDGIEAGRCFSCGGLVMWQDDYAEPQSEVSSSSSTVANIGGVAASPLAQATMMFGTDGASLAGTAPEHTILLGNDSVGAGDSRVSAGRGSTRGDSALPPVAPPIESPTESESADAHTTVDGFKSSHGNLSQAQMQQMQTVWQLSGSVTPRTSLKASAGNELNSEQARHIQTMWQGTLSAQGRGLDSQGDGSGQRKSQRRSTLVIGSRALQGVGEPASRDPDYELLDKIGEGGMGVVYEARQACMDRVVAVKMLHQKIAANLDQRDKFLSEAVITAELDHPNIVPIHDLGSNEAGDLFYSMKRVQGTPWSDCVADKSQDENLEILLKVCDAIAFAHQRGVVHRDLKPENIMLGDFGEVLVMDWGLAMPTAEFRRAESISQSISMGGTPAYMAPEMATGPIESIGRHSDVYLLGAMLFEVITGETPHTGKDTMDCLYAAARNDIQPTGETGELLDIALQAMSTRAEKRHASVQDFQASIRSYQDHVESITLSNRAASELRSARESNDYQEYAAALYGYKEALALWGGNAKAATGLKEAALAYATCAVEKKDFDLAASLLDPAESRHRDLGRKIDAARRERDSRASRLRHLRLFAIVMGTVMFGTVLNAYVWISRDRNKAIAAQVEAETANAQLAENVQKLKDQTDLARQEQRKAEAATTAEKAATRAQKYESYLAQIQLVAEKIDANAYREAKELLAMSRDSDIKNWEWGRSQYLCREFARRWNTLGQVEDVTFAPNGTTFGAVCGGGYAWLWTTTDPDFVLQLPHDGIEVLSLAFSHDSQHVFTGDARGTVRAFHATNGKLVAKMNAHSADIVCLAIVPQLHRMITASYDKTLIIWDISDVERPVALERHPRNAFVLDVDIRPDGEVFVTGSQDGYATIWRRDSESEQLRYKPTTRFSGHNGAVYSVAIAPDGHHVASGGYDKRVLIWDLRKVKPIDLRMIANNIPTEPPVYRALDGHRSPVQSVAFSPDGTRIVSGSMDNTLRVWDATTGELYKTLRGHAYGVRSCMFSHDGTSVLSGSHDKSVRLWKVGDYREVRLLQAHSLAGHSDAVMSARFSQNGKYVVTSSRDRSAIVWDARTETIISRLEEGHDYMATNVRFFSDGTRLLTGGGDNTVRIWNVVAGSEIQRLDNTGRNGIVALSPNGRFLATGDKETVHTWNLESGERVQSLEGHRKNISALVWSHDGNLLVSGDNTGVLALWHHGSDKPTWLVRGHNTLITACEFLPGDKRIITASGDNTVTQWDVETGEEIPDTALPHPGWVSRMVITPDGKHAITLCDDSVVRLWNLDSATVEGTFTAASSPSMLAHNLKRCLRIGKWTTAELAAAAGIDQNRLQEILDRKVSPDDELVPLVAKTLRVPLSTLAHPMVEGISLSADGSRLLTSISHERACRMWDVATQTELPPPGAAAESSTDAPYLQLGTGGILWSAEFSPDGHQIATIGGNEVRLWSFDTGRQEMTFSPHGAVAGAAFSPDEMSVVTAGWDNSAKLWDAKTGVARQKLIGGHTNRINDCTYSPSGRRIATASDDGNVCFWDAASGELLPVRLEGHAQAVVSVRYSPDGTLIATASRDRTAKLWNAETGKLIRSLVDDRLVSSNGAQQSATTHQLGVLCAEFFNTANGLRLITGSDDATAKIWEVDAGRLCFTLQGHIGPITCAGSSPDGKRVITGSRDATAKLWDPETGKEVMTLTGHERDITSISFSPSGRDVLTSSLDGMAIVWPSEPWE